MDDMTTRQVPWARLDELVPDEHDRTGSSRCEFLKIARDALAGEFSPSAARSSRRRAATR